MAVLLVLLLAQQLAPGLASDAAPAVLLMGADQTPGERLVPVGLLYTPDVLAALSADGRAGHPQIKAAIRDRLALVGLYRFNDPMPLHHHDVVWQKRYGVSAGPAEAAAFAASNRKPVWTETDPTLVRALSPGARFEHVALVAAFRESDLVAGDRIFIWQSSVPEPENPSRSIVHSKWGTIPPR
jgi:hypothetical protein